MTVRRFGDVYAERGRNATNQRAQKLNYTSKYEIRKPLAIPSRGWATTTKVVKKQPELHATTREQHGGKGVFVTIPSIASVTTTATPTTTKVRTGV